MIKYLCHRETILTIYPSVCKARPKVLKYPTSTLHFPHKESDQRAKTPGRSSVCRLSNRLSNKGRESSCSSYLPTNRRPADSWSMAFKRSQSRELQTSYAASVCRHAREIRGEVRTTGR